MLVIEWVRVKVSLADIVSRRCARAQTKRDVNKRLGPHQQFLFLIWPVPSADPLQH
jgi:hypothetical protein